MVIAPAAEVKTKPLAWVSSRTTFGASVISFVVAQEESARATIRAAETFLIIVMFKKPIDL
jgi:hypothetical protein